MKKTTTFKTIVFIGFLIINTKFAFAQSFTEGFDDITLLAGTGWSQQNNSTVIGVTNWFQGNLTVAAQFSGTGYIGANFNNTTVTNTISNWLISPNRVFTNGDIITFYSFANPDIYPDRLQVRLSTNGASTNVGAGAAAVGDFTTLLLDINPTLVTGVYPATWAQFSITLSGLAAPTSGRLAFRYYVTNGGPTGANSDYIGIDEFVYTAFTCAPITMSPLTIGNGNAGVAFNQTITALGATGTPTFTLSSGSLPPGLSISSSGVISGTPLLLGSYTFSVSVTDGNGCSGTQTFTITIVCPANSAMLPTYPPICNNSSSFTLSGGSPLGGTYSGVGVSGTTFNPTVGSQVITYTYTDPYTCVNVAATLLTVNAAPTVMASASSNTICSGASVTLSGGGASTYTWSGGATNGVAFAPPTGTTTYTVTGTAVNGCTNTATTTVTVTPAFSTSQTLSICSGQSVTVGSSVYSTSGNYTNLLTSFSGCDSTVSTNLTVASTINSSQTLSICAGDVVTVGTSNYSASGTYSNTLTSFSGCDSIVTTNLTVATAITGSQVLDICAGTFVIVGTSIYFNTGNYSDILTAANGCDSVVATNLTVDAAISTTQNITICLGNTLAVGTNVYNVSGNYTDILNAANSCDSTVHTNLTVQLCTGIHDVSDGSVVTVFPNPGNGEMQFDYNLNTNENAELTITSVLGEKIISFNLSGNTGVLKVDGKQFASGIYFYTLVNSGNIIAVGKVMVE